jgi:hypothetical protein
MRKPGMKMGFDHATGILMVYGIRALGLGYGTILHGPDLVATQEHYMDIGFSLDQLSVI